MNTLAEQLKAWQAAQGLRRAEAAAARVGVSLGTYRRWLAGHRPSAMGAERLASVAKITEWSEAGFGTAEKAAN